MCKRRGYIMGAKKENTYDNYVHADTSGSSNAMKMYLKEIEETANH